MLYGVLRRRAEDQGTVLVTLWTSGCKPYYPVDALLPRRTPKKCSDWFKQGMHTIGSNLSGRLAYVIVSANWVSGGDANQPIKGELQPALLESGISAVAPDYIHPELLVGLAATMAKLRSFKAERILIVGPTPVFVYDAPECVLRADHHRISRDKCSVPREKFEAQRRRTMASLRFLTAQFPDMRLIDPIELFCDEGMCRPYDEKHILYDDYHHVNDYGVAKLYAAFKQDFEWAFNGE